MTNVMKEVINCQKESDKMFLEIEEKRMKHEAKQRKEEREFQLRMMSVLFSNQGTRIPPEQYGPYQPCPNFSNSYTM